MFLGAARAMRAGFANRNAAPILSQSDTRSHRPGRWKPQATAPPKNTRAGLEEQQPVPPGLHFAGARSCGDGAARFSGARSNDECHRTSLSRRRARASRGNAPAPALAAVRHFCLAVAKRRAHGLGTLCARRLHAFHIDGGVGEEEKVRLSLARQLPYYVDHAAGKGILYLRKDVQRRVMRRAALQVRPHSLADPATIATLKSMLRENIAVTRNGLVYAYAFDDEISLGSFNNPAEVDIHPLSVAWYRKWLSHRYRTIARLNAAWASEYGGFDEVRPLGFEEVRQAVRRAPLAAWNLSPWMEWRAFMDYQFAQVLTDLTRYANTLDGATPAGFVGAQQPSAYGGFDYGLLSRAVQWMEASDLSGVNEMLRSFWNRPRRVQVQTYQASAPHKMNVWMLWYRLAHGNQAAIAWPEGWMRDAGPASAAFCAIERLAATFREVHGGAGEFILDPDSYLEADPSESIIRIPAYAPAGHGQPHPRRHLAATHVEIDTTISLRLGCGCRGANCWKISATNSFINIWRYAREASIWPAASESSSCRRRFACRSARRGRCAISWRQAAC